MTKSSRLFTSLLTSTAMVYSSVAGAAISQQRKLEINTLVKEFQKSSYSELYQRYGNFLDTPSRGIFETWLEKFGEQKIESIRVEPVKGKNKQDILRILIVMNGQTMTLQMDESQPEVAEINGEKFSLWEVSNFQTVASRLATKDAKFNNFVTASETAPPAQNINSGRAYALSQLPAEKKVEFLMILRQTRESAERVMNSFTNPEIAQAANSQSSNYALHPLLASLVAEANKGSRPIPKPGTACGAAGGQYVYANGQYMNSQGKMVTGIRCDPFSKNSEIHSDCNKLQTAMGGVSALADAKAQHLVACPPLLYGGWTDGQGQVHPYCQNSRVPTFTAKATVNCSEMSPLRGEPESEERLKDTRRIVESLAKMKGKGSSQLAACFNESNRLSTSEVCTQTFEALMTEINSYIDEAMKECVPPELKQKTADQKFYCEELSKRKVSLEYFAKVNLVVPDSKDADACKLAGGDLVPQPGAKNSLKACVCKAEKVSDPVVLAKKVGGSYVKCGARPAAEPRPAAPVAAEDKCDKPENKDKKECNEGGAGWLSNKWPLLLIPPLLFLMFRSRGGSPTPFPAWLREGNNGQSGGTGAGGSVRGVQPQPRMTIPATPTGTGTK
jgi:hypothetical protein